MLALSSETILEYFCPEGVAPFMLVLTSKSILEYFCPEGFAQSFLACSVLRNYFRIVLSTRAYLIRSDRTCLEGFTQSVHDLLCPEGLTQSLKKFQLLKISI